MAFVSPRPDRRFPSIVPQHENESSHAGNTPKLTNTATGRKSMEDHLGPEPSSSSVPSDISQMWHESIAHHATKSPHARINRQLPTVLTDSSSDVVVQSTGRNTNQSMKKSHFVISGRARRERRPSESFFDSSSSEEEDFESEEPVIKRANDVKLSRISALDQGAISNKLQTATVPDLHPPYEGPDSLAGTTSAGNHRSLKTHVTVMVDEPHMLFTGKQTRPGQAINSDFFEVAATDTFEPLVSNVSPFDSQGADPPILSRVLSTLLGINVLENRYSHNFHDAVGHPTEDQFAPQDADIGTHKQSAGQNIQPLSFSQNRRSNNCADDNSSQSKTGNGEDKRLKLEHGSLYISLDGYSAANISIKIGAQNTASFDDEVLFNLLRQAYLKKLLGWSRIGFRFVREIHRVTLVTPCRFENDLAVEKNFLKQFSDPRFGHGRSDWVGWLWKHDEHSRICQHTRSACKTARINAKQ